MQIDPVAPAPLRVLVSWELGSRLGHLLRLEPIARALLARGHAVTWAVPDPQSAARQLFDGAWSLHRVPRAGGTPDPRPASYAAMLSAVAFGDDASLDAAMQDWGRLLQDVRPDVVLADHSPLTLLAARVHHLPAVHLATGWDAPPPGMQLPVLRPGLASPARLLAIEQALIRRIDRIGERHGLMPLAELAQLYEVQATLFATLPELDHFAPRFAPARAPHRVASYVGPIFTDDRGDEPCWRGRGVHRAFVYLARRRRSFAFVEALVAMGIEVVACIAGIDEAQRAALEGPLCSVHARPVRLRAALAGCDVVVCNANFGVASAALLAGIPLVVTPTHIEQVLFARRLVATGAAVAVAHAASLRDAIRALPHARACAQTIAARYRGFDPASAAAGVARAVERVGAHSRHLAD